MKLARGHVVQVPFGRQRVTGYVIGIEQTTDLKSTKAVSRLLDPLPAFDDIQLEFFRWMSDYYMTGLGEVIATALPSGHKAKIRRVYVPSEVGIEALASEAFDEEDPLALVLREVIARPGRTRGGLARTLNQELDADAVRRNLERLVRQQRVVVEEREMGTRSGRIAVVQLTVEPQSIPLVGGIRMRGVLARLAEADGTMDLATLIKLEGATARNAVKRLAERGLVTLSDREDRGAVIDPVLPESKSPPKLNSDQKAAVDAISASQDQVFLLHGVTGSGKTEVYLRVTSTILQRSRQTLVLVPEIALTPQLVGRFRARFGERIAVLHSGLTPNDRLREWRRIRAGEADVAIGARSALFAPFKNLGFIVVDEEHDDSYKQDDGVRYHARDLAVVRGKIAKCPVVLGSATPSVESWQNAQEGRYARLTLPKRATARPIPNVELVDMRGRKAGSPLAQELLAALKNTLDAGEQAIVLYNRRGYAPVIECRGCGATYTCPSCGVGSLVYHQRQGRLRCHYCGFRRDYEENCPACGTQLSVVGYGTERVAEALSEAFPQASIARMDAGTTQGRGAHQRILEAFQRGGSQILVGTQLVAKGHDFPGVTLAAVVGVDHVLLMPDFRSAERTYGLVTQLAGRAGRGTQPGRVILQTRHPDHFVFSHIGPDTPLDAFYESECQQRKVLAHPPFSRIVMVRFESNNMDNARKAAGGMAHALRQTADGGSIQVFGPTLAPLSKLVGRWRFQVVLRGRNVPQFRAWLRHTSEKLQRPPQGNVRMTVDIDPRNLM